MRVSLITFLLPVLVVVSALRCSPQVICDSTKIPVVLDDSLDSVHLTDKQTIRAHVKDDILVDGKVCIPANTICLGRVVKDANHTGREYTLDFDQLSFSNGSTITLSAIPRVRGSVVKVKRNLQEFALTAAEGRIPTDNHALTKRVAIITGSRLVPPDLNAGDEIVLNVCRDIKLLPAN